MNYRFLFNLIFSFQILRQKANNDIRISEEVLFLYMNESKWISYRAFNLCCEAFHTNKIEKATSKQNNTQNIISINIQIISKPINIFADTARRTQVSKITIYILVENQSDLESLIIQKQKSVIIAPKFHLHEVRFVPNIVYWRKGGSFVLVLFKQCMLRPVFQLLFTSLKRNLTISCS